MRQIGFTPIKTSSPQSAVKAPGVGVGANNERRWWKTVGSGIGWFVNFINLTAIYIRMFPRRNPVTGKRTIATFWLWIFGIYAAMYGIASARYESALDRLEVRSSILTNAIFNNESRAMACSQVGVLQREEIRIPPEFLDPWVTLQSFLGAKSVDEGTVKLLKDSVVSVKQGLQGASLLGANLYKANLTDANLSGADLRAAELSRAKLYGANLRDAYLSDADLSRATLYGANLFRADLGGANLTAVNLVKANLTLADLFRADLSRISYIGNANIYGVKNAPDGFREWALANGACEMEDVETWKRNGCPPQQSPASNE